LITFSVQNSIRKEDQMIQKLQSAKQRYRSEGLTGLFTLYPRRAYEWMQTHDALWGRFVEFRGNKVNIDGLEFLVDVPAITRKQKAKFLFDRYERPERLAAKRFLNPSLPVIEFGGNIGVVSCVINKKLNNPEKHIVVEANPELIPYLERNRENNNCQFQVINYAVAHGVNEISFNLADDILGSNAQVKTGRCVTVQAITLKSILEQTNFPICTLVCDIEGNEIDLIKHEAGIIKERVSTMLMEVHPNFTGQPSVDNMLDSLQDLGFEILFNRWSNVVLQNTLLK